MNPFANFDVSALVASSTTSYLVVFSPIFIFIIGLVLAMSLIVAIIGLFSKNDNTGGYDDLVADDII